MHIDEAAVTFFLQSAELKAEGMGGYFGTVSLTAKVRDIGLWDRILEQLNGLQVFKGQDFKTELIRTLQDHKGSLEEKMELADRAHFEEMERLKQHYGAEKAARLQAEQKLRFAEIKLQTLEEELGQLANQQVG